MRLPLTIGAIVALLIGLLLTMPAAHAQNDYYNSPYPYFRRTGSGTTSSSSRSSSSVSSVSSVTSQIRPIPTVSSVSSTPTVGLSLESDRSEANPGDEVLYWIKARNLYVRDLPSWKVAFFFDHNQMQIIDASNARGDGDHLTFIVPSMRPNEDVTFSVRVRLLRNLKPGTVIRTYGSMIWDGSIGAACSKNDLVIIARPPVTGIGDNTGPVENLQAFIRPISAASNGSPMPLMVWMGIALTGITLGGIVGKRVQRGL